MPKAHKNHHTFHKAANAASFALKGAKHIKNAINAFSNKETDTKGEVSTYHDTSVLYKKRGRSKKTLKQLEKKKRFKLKVENAMKPIQPMNSLCECNSSVQTVNAPAGGQVGIQYIWPAVSGYYASMINYGQAYGTGLHGLPLIFQTTQNTLNRNDAVTATAPLAATLQIKFQNTNSILHIKNASADNLIFDCYQFVAAIDIADASYKSPYDTWNYILNNSNHYSTLFPAQAITNAGANPLDCPGFGKIWKLINKTRFELGSTAKATVQMIKVPKFTAMGEDIINKYALKGKTMGWIVIAHGNTAAVSASNPVITAFHEVQTHFRTMNAGPSGMEDTPYAGFQYF